MATGVDFKVEIDDNGLRRIVELGSKLGRGDHEVKVGVFSSLKGGGDADASGLTQVAKAAIHEFGAPEAGIPQRSFLRATFDGHYPTYVGLVRKLLPLVILGKMQERQMFDIVGAQAVTDINKRVRQAQGPAYDFAPLKPETIARKGSSRPLIDTGRMLASVTWVTLTGRG